ncbi:MAG: hypothetical protein AUG51_06165 [Acidobacteria bacterium 13_1_20CM_3_53_8]|nr:MAG: hypothetical protein AUG51_06165 [Acidobacteria bacterium 13_1_20CM_3_53_8]
MQEDQVISRIREARRQISEECEHDPHKLVAYYKELQKKHKERIVRSEEDKENIPDEMVKA